MFWVLAGGLLVLFITAIALIVEDRSSTGELFGIPLIAGGIGALFAFLITMLVCAGGAERGWLREVRKEFTIHSIMSVGDAPLVLQVHREGTGKFVYSCDIDKGDGLERVSIPLNKTIISILPDIEEAVGVKTVYHSTFWAISSEPVLYELFLPQGSLIVGFRAVKKGDK